MIRTRICWSTIGRRRFLGESESKEYLEFRFIINLPARIAKDDLIALESYLDLVDKVQALETSTSEEWENIDVNNETFDLFGTQFGYSVDYVRWEIDNHGIILECRFTSECNE